jgi:uncharacterized protein
VTTESLPLVLAVLAVALLYSSVGHAGASGYIAVMSLAGLAPEVIRPTALLLNVLVASIASFQFWRAKRFSWPLFWPFALSAVPMAFVGGAIALPIRVFQIVVGSALLLSAAWLLLRPRGDIEPVAPRRVLALGAGAGVGLLAGLTGTGGGIFLTPLLLLRRWARAQTAAAVTAPFVLLNSVAGLAGNLSVTRELPALALPLAAAVAAGGFVGSRLGSRRLPHVAIERLLALVLVIAGTKLVLGL